MENTKITIATEELTVTVELAPGETIESMLDTWKGMMNILGYHPESIKGAILSEADNIKQ